MNPASRAASATAGATGMAGMMTRERSPGPRTPVISRIIPEQPSLHQVSPRALARSEQPVPFDHRDHRQPGNRRRPDRHRRSAFAVHSSPGGGPTGPSRGPDGEPVAQPLGRPFTDVGESHPSSEVRPPTASSAHARIHLARPAARNGVVHRRPVGARAGFPGRQHHHTILALDGLRARTAAAVGCRQQRPGHRRRRKDTKAT